MAETNGTVTNGTECPEFDTKPYAVLALVSAGSATLSALASTVVIFLILSLKKYIFFVQRLILYLCVAALLNSIAIMLRFQRVKNFYTNQETVPLHIFCTITGFVDQLTAWSITIAFACVTFNLLLTAVFKRETEKLELLYLALIVIFPITFNWVPFLQDSYGDAGAWCWIRSVNKDCMPFQFGTDLRFFLWYIPGTIIVLAVVLTYIFIVAWVTRQRHKWAGKYDQETKRQKKNLQKEVWPLLFYPLGFLVLNIFSLINRIQGAIDPNRPVYALWVLHAVFTPLQGGYIALNYILSADTRKSLSCTKIRANLFHKEAAISEYSAGQGVTDSWSAVQETGSQEKGRIESGNPPTKSAFAEHPKPAPENKGKGTSDPE